MLEYTSTRVYDSHAVDTVIRGYRAATARCCSSAMCQCGPYYSSTGIVLCNMPASEMPALLHSAAATTTANHELGRKVAKYVSSLLSTSTTRTGKGGTQGTLSRPRRQTLRLAVEGMWSIAPVVVCFSLRSSPAPSSEDRPCRFKAFAIEGQPDFANGRAVGAGGRNRRAARVRARSRTCARR